ncbi:MAG: M48 family metalloprotease [Deltaproteobacteria bacterium]|nr:M48 family metalloprotease [Deltaproteobacteria bacterium]MBW2013121.1 M48 family metalloprotease [Deltaproteobacteria bacterium]MBW2319488.1 M48 family metalloprotease [Deltaproteobacteria bacterium]OQY09980.1 MAG: peptidase M48 Ste24p [Desulfobacteraceae bacterium 4572_187]
MQSKRIQSRTEYGITRREFLWISSMSAAGFMVGCAANPVTGKPQFMMVSEDQEIKIDKQNSPHQFSSDYGPLQDTALNNYINQTGKTLAARTHRPHMPYSFRGVNATYVNAYAFPGGSIAATRGILLDLENEAQLAALLGHELGHVNARHTAEQMSKSTLINLFVGGLSTVVGTQSSGLGNLASQLGMVGAGALLASYSRDNEREADALGLEYMVRAGYNAKGFVGLMDMLRRTSKYKPSAIELMFATHPMSDERYRTAVEAVDTQYRSSQSFSLYRDRYMDHTAKLRKIKLTIEELQKGETLMAKNKYGDAEIHFSKALKQTPEDYAGLVMMSKCQLAQKHYAESGSFAEKAKMVYPQEGQAYYLSGFTKIKQKDYASAYEEFKYYEKLLSGNPNIIFFKGLSLEGMQHIKKSANEYYKYLQVINQGEKAKYAYQRLVQWGYIKK